MILDLDDKSKRLIIIQPKKSVKKFEWNFIAELSGIFTFVGMNVNNEVLKQEDGSYLCDLNEYGEVIVDLKMKTSTLGLYAAGDVRVNAAKQVVCAAADGAVAALGAIGFVEGH
ncbi:TPA: hypothetical protein EYP70_06830 [Candidatus Bathyarchaeota archaeon]|nr:hypothetical protein [Candidatus Bathyarchaeota archaeon]